MILSIALIIIQGLDMVLAGAVVSIVRSIQASMVEVMDMAADITVGMAIMAATMTMAIGDGPAILYTMALHTGL